MKKVALLAVLALSFIATAKTTSKKVENPLPTCNPCSWVK
jgi:hypothetical protein